MKTENNSKKLAYESAPATISESEDSRIEEDEKDYSRPPSPSMSSVRKESVEENGAENLFASSPKFEDAPLPPLVALSEMHMSSFEESQSSSSASTIVNQGFEENI